MCPRPMQAPDGMFNNGAQKKTPTKCQRQCVVPKGGSMWGQIDPLLCTQVPFKVPSGRLNEREKRACTSHQVLSEALKGRLNMET